MEDSKDDTSSSSNAVMDWGIDQSQEETKDPIFRNNSTKVVPIASLPSKTGESESSATARDFDAETAFMNTETGGFHFQRNKSKLL